ncbi:MAG TPA: isoprenylcysteine carboxylmethyltransferase family protein [Candidatus Dormibacteraeota bacterium]|nr:isoprenylcysteine carboxylmethyltransferase family protein [Candidatus Dormibacteraeota bacterium]
MQPVYVGDAFAQALYELVLLLWLSSEAYHGLRVFVRIARARDGIGPVRQDRLSGPALIAGIGLAIGLGIRAAVFVPQAAITFARPEVFTLGLGLAVAGIAFRWYAIARLGRFFTTRVMVAAGQTVVDTGPYRLVRHPSYTGALLTVLGVLLSNTNWLTLACFLLVIPGFAYRIAVEERVLAGGIGQPYRDYMRRTKRLIPYVL